MRDTMTNPFDDSFGVIHVTLYRCWPFIKIRFEPSASAKSFIKFVTVPDGYVHTYIDKKFPFVHISWESNMENKWKEPMDEIIDGKRLCLLCSRIQSLEHDCPETYPQF